MTARRVFAAAVLLAGWFAARWARHPDDLHDIWGDDP